MNAAIVATTYTFYTNPSCHNPYINKPLQSHTHTHIYRGGRGSAKDAPVFGQGGQTHSEGGAEGGAGGGQPVRLPGVRDGIYVVFVVYVHMRYTALCDECDILYCVMNTHVLISIDSAGCLFLVQLQAPLTRSYLA